MSQCSMADTPHVQSHLYHGIQSSVHYLYLSAVGYGGEGSGGSGWISGGRGGAS